VIVALLTTPRGGTSRPAPSGWYRGPGNRLADALRARGADVLLWWDEPAGPALTDDLAVACLRAGSAENQRRARELVARGVPVVNDPWAHADAGDKWLTAERLLAAGVPHPPTVPLTAAGPAWGHGRQVVLKSRRGAGGEGVSLLEPGAPRPEDAEAWLLQAFVPVLEDYRVAVVGGEAVAWMRRTPAAGDFRTNLRLGASAEPCPCPSAELAAVAVAAVAALGLDVAGVDLALGPEGPVVFEANPAPTTWMPDPDDAARVADALAVLLLERARTAGAQA
jgi:glutathione synthase/RimK-type ligase-like ATP-grasp enzyme